MAAASDTLNEEEIFYPHHGVLSPLGNPALYHKAYDTHWKLTTTPIWDMYPHLRAGVSKMDEQALHEIS
jgi:hypothetical protein